MSRIIACLVLLLPTASTPSSSVPAARVVTAAPATLKPPAPQPQLLPAAPPSSVRPKAVRPIVKVTPSSSHGSARRGAKRAPNPRAGHPLPRVAAATGRTPAPTPPARARAVVDYPHTTAGLRAFAASLGWPWQGIIGCESLRDGSWRTSSSSMARGIVQFLRSTWASLGLTGDPAAASWRDQIRAAIRLWHRDGLRHSWVCARILGYR